MKNKLLKAVLALFLISSLSFLSCQSKNPTENLIIKKTSSDNSEISLKCELAISAESQQKGFMERKNIPFGTGMLFVFSKDQIMHFWMKNTPTALSIAYIDSKGVIKEMHDLTPFSEETVSSLRSLRFALEVPQGWFEKNNINIGDKILISPFVAKSANIVK